MLTGKGFFGMNDTTALALHDHIVTELEASYIYLQMAEWLDVNSFPGFAARFRAHAREQIGNAMIVFNFLENHGIPVTLGTMRARSFRCRSLQDVTGRLLARGKHIASGIDRLLGMVETSDNEELSALLAWFTSVQLGEEAMVTDILEQIHACQGDASQAASQIDSELTRCETTIPQLLKTQRRHGMA